MSKVQKFNFMYRKKIFTNCTVHIKAQIPFNKFTVSTQVLKRSYNAVNRDIASVPSTLVYVALCDVLTLFVQVTTKSPVSHLVFNVERQLTLVVAQCHLFLKDLPLAT
jgi:hypothetical protein